MILLFLYICAERNEHTFFGTYSFECDDGPWSPSSFGTYVVSVIFPTIRAEHNRNDIFVAWLECPGEHPAISHPAPYGGTSLESRFYMV